MLTKIKHKLGGLKALNIIASHISLNDNLKFISCSESNKVQITFRDYSTIQNKSKFKIYPQRG